MRILHLFEEVCVSRVNASGWGNCLVNLLEEIGLLPGDSDWVSVAVSLSSRTKGLGDKRLIYLGLD